MASSGKLRLGRILKIIMSVLLAAAVWPAFAGDGPDKGNARQAFASEAHEILPPGAQGGCLACGTHFPGHGDTDRALVIEGR